MRSTDTRGRRPIRLAIAIAFTFLLALVVANFVSYDPAKSSVKSEVGDGKAPT